MPACILSCEYAKQIGGIASLASKVANMNFALTSPVNDIMFHFLKNAKVNER